MLSWEIFRSSTNWVWGTIIYIISSTSRIYGQIRIFHQNQKSVEDLDKNLRNLWIVLHRVFNGFHFCFPRPTVDLDFPEISPEKFPSSATSWGWTTRVRSRWNLTVFEFCQETKKGWNASTSISRSYFIYFMYEKRQSLLLGFQISSNLILLEISSNIINLPWVY